MQLSKSNVNLGFNSPSFGGYGSQSAHAIHDVWYLLTAPIKAMAATIGRWPKQVKTCGHGPSLTHLNIHINRSILDITNERQVIHC